MGVEPAGRLGLQRLKRSFAWLDAFAIIWNQTIAFLLVTLQPILVGALVDQAHFGLAAAGRVVSTNMFGCFLGALGTVWLIRHFEVRLLVAFGTLVMLTGEVMAGLTVGAPSAFFVANATAGLGTGVTMSSGSACASAFERPDRLFAGIMIGQTIAGTLLMLVGEPVLRSVGIDGGLFALAALCATQLLLLSRFAEPPAAMDRVVPANAAIRITLPVLASCCLFYIANSGIYANFERLAHVAGLNDVWIGPVLAFSQAFGVVGAAVAARLSVRLDRRNAIFIACGMISAVTFVLSQTHGTMVFAGSLALFMAAISFAVPFYFGALADGDPTGRALVLGQLALLLGFAIGPAVAGVIAEAHSLQTTCVAACGLFMLAFVAATAMRRPGTTASASN